LGFAHFFAPHRFFLQSKKMPKAEGIAPAERRSKKKRSSPGGGGGI
jgi:hypothetical protein